MITWEAGNFAHMLVKVEEILGNGGVLVKLPSGPKCVVGPQELTRAVIPSPVDYSKIEIGDRVYSRSTVIEIDPVGPLGIMFKVQHDGEASDKYTWIDGKAIVDHEPVRVPATPGEFRSLPQEVQDLFLNRWMAAAKGGA